MTKENIKNLVELQAEFQDACENVCKHLRSLDDDFKHCYEFEIDTVSDQVECRGYYTVMNESQDVYKAFPVELITYTNEQLDDYVSKKLVGQSEMATLRKLADKYGYKIIKS
jgi:hypothetical protein